MINRYSSPLSQPFPFLTIPHTTSAFQPSSLSHVSPFYQHSRIFPPIPPYSPLHPALGIPHPPPLLPLHPIHAQSIPATKRKTCTSSSKQTKKSKSTNNQAQPKLLLDTSKQEKHQTIPVEQNKSVFSQSQIPDQYRQELQLKNAYLKSVANQRTSNENPVECLAGEVTEESSSSKSTIDCPVCGDIAIAHFHYGGMCCYSCKAFFRRVVNTYKVGLDFINSYI